MVKNFSESCEFNIRIADPTDAQLLVTLGRTSFYEAFARETDPEDMAAHLRTAFRIEDITEQLAGDRSLFIIIERASVAAGYAYLQHADSPPCVKTPNPIQLVRFYLRRQYYGRHFGDALMKACLEMAGSKGFESVWLSTWEFNHRANAFYKKWDFKVVGRAKFKVGSDIQNDFIFARRI